MVEQSTIKQFLSAIERLTRCRDHIPADLARGEPYVLNYLYDRDSARPSQISVDMQVSTARVTTILNNLEKQGMVVRQADEGDRRKVNARLTEEGRTYVAHVRARLWQVVSAVLEQLGVEDTAELIRILDRLVDIHDRLPPEPTAR